MLQSDNLAPGVYGVLGGAGSGKSTYCRSLKAENPLLNIIHVDDFFIGDSQYRKRLLEEKQQTNLSSLKDACNQFNWWDWPMVFREIENSLSAVTIVEGAMLGPGYILKLFKIIYVLDESPEIRLKRLIERDGKKRSITEICARFLITEYSEDVYYKNLDQETIEKMIVLKYARNTNEKNYIPVEV